MDLHSTYMGMELKHPIVASSSPLSEKLENIKLMEDAGAAAVVMFSLFEEQGIFNPRSGKSFMEHVLEKGGSEDANLLFRAFRGREPSIEPLLRHNGIAA